MTPERWQHIKEIFYGALERPPGGRAAFIESACAGDEEARREVSQLISAHEESGEFLAAPAFEAAARSLARGVGAGLVEGQVVTHYRVVRQIGAGGMGEVYLAEDTRLGRKVALKLLPASFANDPDRARRFEREARAASALNHPNIITVHEVGQTEGGVHFIATEYVEGVTLRRRMCEGRLPLVEALDVAAQVASALTAAHQAGVLHRDVKPENVMLRPDGIVKVLDFGLAKLTEQPRAAGSAVPTQPLVQTETGMVMGTPRYMSPEQARGLDVDGRTDVWSLGVLLYEMVTGAAPFEGATNSDVIVSVLEREPPPLTDHSPEAPAEIQRIITKALRKDREERYRVVEDLFSDLKGLAQELEFNAKADRAAQPQSSDVETVKYGGVRVEGRTDPQAVPKTSPAFANFTTSGISHFSGGAKRRKRGVTVALLGAGLVSVVMFTYWSRAALLPLILEYTRGANSGPQPSPVRVVPFTSFPGREDQAAFSPDGNQVAFVWGGEKDDNPDIYVKSVGGERPLRLTSDPGIDILPAWAPDGQRVAFVRISEGRFAVYTVPALGGPERRLLPLSHHPQKISWSPDGNFIALVEKASGREAARIFLYSPETGEKRVLTSPPAQAWGDFGPAFSPDGQTLAFMRASTEVSADLYLVPTSGGEPKRLTSDGSLHFYEEGVVGGITWAADGRAIIYASEAGGAPSLWKVSTSGGAPERLPVGGVDVFYPSISRPGNRLVYTQIFGAKPIYQIEARGTTGRYGAPVKLIFSTRSDLTPDFSPDGKSIAFASDRSGSYEIWVCNADGANPVQVTSFGGPRLGSPRWSPDGKQIAFDVHPTDVGDIYVVGVEGGRPRLVTTDGGVPSWSGDGRWIYFASRRGGDEQVWKVPAEGGQAVQVTRHGGFTTYESADGRFLYYSKGPAGPGVWRVPVDGGEETLILDAPNAGGWGGWAVVDEGIYFINTKVKGEYAVEFFSFATRGVRQVAALEIVNEFVGGLAVSPDRRRILYTQRERLAGDIMLVENFR